MREAAEVAAARAVERAAAKDAEPAKKPVKPAKKPAKKSTKKPAKKPTKKPAKPAKKPAKPAAKKPAKPAAKKPAKKPVKKPAEKPAKPAKKPTAAKKPPAKELAERARQERLAQRREAERLRRVKAERAAKRDAKRAVLEAAKKAAEREVEKAAAAAEEVEEASSSEQILRDAFKHGVEKKEIERPTGEQIRSADRHGYRFERSMRVHLLNDDIIEQFRDLVARVSEVAFELRDFIHTLPSAIESQAIPRFWMTTEFLSESKLLRNGSPRKFFSKGKGPKSVEIAVAYNGFGAVRIEKFTRLVEAYFRAVANGPPTLTFAIHVGAIFQVPKRRRRKKHRS